MRPAEGLWHAGRRTRREAFGRRAPACGDCPGLPRRCTDPDSGRGDVQPQFGIGGADPAGDGAADGGPHDAGYRAPAVDRACARPAAGLRPWPDRRGGRPRPADPARGRHLSPAVRTAGAGTDQRPICDRKGRGSGAALFAVDRTPCQGPTHRLRPGHDHNRPFRTVSDRPHPYRQCAHRAVQLAVRAEEQGPFHPAFRRHRHWPLETGICRRHSLRSALAGYLPGCGGLPVEALRHL